jgi:hypothetical protein
MHFCLPLVTVHPGKHLQQGRQRGGKNLMEVLSPRRHPHAHGRREASTGRRRHVESSTNLRAEEAGARRRREQGRGPRRRSEAAAAAAALNSWPSSWACSAAGEGGGGPEQEQSSTEGEDGELSLLAVRWRTVKRRPAEAAKRGSTDLQMRFHCLRR